MIQDAQHWTIKLRQSIRKMATKQRNVWGPDPAKSFGSDRILIWIHNTVANTLHTPKKYRYWTGKIPKILLLWKKVHLFRKQALKRIASHLDCEEVWRSSLEEFDLASDAKEPTVPKSCFCWLFTETDRSGGSGLVRVPVGDGSDEEESPPTRKKS
jgi:hypothetical protein